MNRSDQSTAAKAALNVRVRRRVLTKIVAGRLLSLSHLLHPEQNKLLVPVPANLFHDQAVVKYKGQVEIRSLRVLLPRSMVCVSGLNQMQSEAIPG
ncbi:hypothetical protein DTL42_07535 [Bremerella cremea]|uniref:Uncharacterized protein n=1 Tax=Bremerella cremea TaxID=1031537 RepID=A0A368KSZ8_9BACT|nr:hypothetical protein DTL42_07535 [Bremerella cremea]